MVAKDIAHLSVAFRPARIATLVAHAMSSSLTGCEIMLRPTKSLKKPVKKLRAVLLHGLRHVVEDRLFGAFGVVAGLQHERHERRHEHSLRHQLAGVVRHVSGDLAATHPVVRNGPVFEETLSASVGRVERVTQSVPTTQALLATQCKFT